MKKYSFIIPYSGISVNLTSQTGLLLANNFNRIVIGGRGPYIEFEKEHLFFDNFFIPEIEKWRLYSNLAYYNEYRSIDESYVKLYEQKQTVKYADYKIGKFYISPYTLYKAGKCVIIKNLEIRSLDEFFS